MSEVFCALRLKPTWQNSRWLPSSSWVRRNEWIIFLCKWWKPILVSVSEVERKYYDGWIQDGQIQDGCHHQVESEWMSEVFLLKMAETKMAEFKMVAIFKLSKKEWVNYFFVQMVGTNLGKCEWVWKEILWWLNPRWPNSRWQNSRFLTSSS